MKFVCLAVAASCALACGASAARAQTPPMDQCLWSNAPAALRDKMLAAVPSAQDVSNAMIGGLTGEVVGADLTACKGPMDVNGSRLIGASLMAHSLMEGGLARLKAKNPEAESVLEAQWAMTPQGVRDRFSAMLDPARQTAASDADYNARVLAIVEALKLDQADGNTLYAYLAGRSQIEILRRPKA